MGTDRGLRWGTEDDLRKGRGRGKTAGDYRNGTDRRWRPLAPGVHGFSLWSDDGGDARTPLPPSRPLAGSLTNVLAPPILGIYSSHRSSRRSVRFSFRRRRGGEPSDREAEGRPPPPGSRCSPKVVRDDSGAVRGGRKASRRRTGLSPEEKDSLWAERRGGPRVRVVCRTSGPPRYPRLRRRKV